MPLEILSDDLLHYFKTVFEQDHRQVFPIELLAKLMWKTCTSCGLEHSRVACPACIQPIQAASKTEVVRGRCHCEIAVQTGGMILDAKLAANGALLYLKYENGNFFRENDQVLLSGELNPHLRFSTGNKRTGIAHFNSLAVFDNGDFNANREVDAFCGEPAFAFQGANEVWVSHGQLMTLGRYGPETIGSVLTNQSRVWLGDKYGFGIQVAGGWRRAFLFDPVHKGINNNISMPAYHGELVDSFAIVGDTLIWLVLIVQQNSRTEQIVAVYNTNGEMIATSIRWEDSLAGGLSMGNCLFIATDEGIKQLGVGSGIVVEKARFPDTAALVDSNVKLLGDATRLFGVREQDIVRIRI